MTRRIWEFAKKILGMGISRENGVVHLSQKRYIKKVLERFNMHMSKPVSTPLASHFKLLELQMPQSMDEMDHMSKVSYASAVGSIMYARYAHVQIFPNLLVWYEGTWKI